MELTKLNSINQWPKEKMDKWTEQSFFKGSSPDGQETQEEMLNKPVHKGNENQKHIMISTHSC
jgi:hypothetical protein